MGVQAMRALKNSDVQRSSTLVQIQATKAEFERLTKELERIDREREELLKNMLLEAFLKSGKSIEEVLTFLG